MEICLYLILNLSLWSREEEDITWSHCYQQNNWTLTAEETTRNWEPCFEEDCGKSWSWPELNKKSRRGTPVRTSKRLVKNYGNSLNHEMLIGTLENYCWMANWLYCWDSEKIAYCLLGKATNQQLYRHVHKLRHSNYLLDGKWLYRWIAKGYRLTAWWQSN